MNTALAAKKNAKKRKKRKHTKEKTHATAANKKKRENIHVRLQKHKQRNDDVLQKEAQSLVDSIPSEQGHDASVLDALAPQFMHLPPDKKKHLLKGILKRRRRAWARYQGEAQRKHLNKIETHRPINVQDIKDLISGKLEVSGLEKQTLVHFQFEPMKIYSKAIAADLDRAIDSACKLCVWDF